MKNFQERSGDIIYLTDEGIARINSFENNYSPDTAPLSPVERDWSTWNTMALWIGMLVSIAVYQVASGLIVSGMSGIEALFTIVAGHTLVMVAAVGLGHFGTKYGMTFPMLSRLVFGVRGTIIPYLVRAVLGCFWFGVQCWIGGQAVNTILVTFVPFWSGMGFTGMFISFIIFWIINVYIALAGSKGVKILESYSAPVLIILSFLVILWSLNVAGWNINTLLSVREISGTGDFKTLFFPALSAMIAFDGGIALSMPDFTRHNKTQKQQFVGQLAAAPFMTGYIAFVGICGTAGSVLAFGEAIWEPAVLVSKFGNPFVVLAFSIFIMAAVLTTNVAGNLVPATLIITTNFAEKVTYRKAAVIAAILGLFSMPWYTMANPENLIFNVLGTLGAMLGPITGIYLVSYFLEHKTNVDMVDIYREDSNGKYFYKNGFNKEAAIIFIATMIIIIGSSFIPTIKFIYDNSYVVGGLATAIAYYIFIKSKNK